MAHSLEVRVPFLDNELVEIARRIPSHLKHANGGGKRLLRRAMSGLLPEEILEKRKQGFSPPDESWYRGPSMDEIRGAAARSARRSSAGTSSRRSSGACSTSTARDGENHRLLIWSLLCFEWWNRLFIDGEPRTRHSAWHAATVP